MHAYGAAAARLLPFRLIARISKRRGCIYQCMAMCACRGRQQNVTFFLLTPKAMWKWMDEEWASILASSECKQAFLSLAKSIESQLNIVYDSLSFEWQRARNILYWYSGMYGANCQLHFLTASVQFLSTECIQLINWRFADTCGLPTFFSRCCCCCYHLSFVREGRGKPLYHSAFKIVIFPEDCE